MNSTCGNEDELDYEKETEHKDGVTFPGETPANIYSLQIRP